MRATTIVGAVLGLTTEALAIHPHINQTVEVAPTPTPTPLPIHAQAKPRAGPTRPTANGTRPEKRKSYDGWCGLHYHVEQSGFQLKYQDAKLFVYDPVEKLISSGEIQDAWNGQAGGEVLDHPIYFKIHPFSLDGDQVDFHFGDDHWGTGPPGQKNDRCSVGNWDYGNWPFSMESWRQLDLDCGFSC
ncbi:hypothetical protein PG984_003078 [Apiospora sp. TS-2023a]